LAIMTVVFLDAFNASAELGTPYKTEQSPSGSFIVEYYQVENKDNEVWLAPAGKAESRYRLHDYGLGAKVVFSPDEKWIALNNFDRPDTFVVILFKRGKDGRYKEVKNARISARSWAMMRRAAPYLKGVRFNRQYTEAVDWSGDSRAILIRLSGEDTETLDVFDNWYCVFDTQKFKASQDLALLNRGKYHRGEHQLPKLRRH